MTPPGDQEAFFYLFRTEASSNADASIALNLHNTLDTSARHHLGTMVSPALAATLKYLPPLQDVEDPSTRY